jgi:hypothetical protein
MMFRDRPTHRLKPVKNLAEKCNILKQKADFNFGLELMLDGLDRLISKKIKRFSFFLA